MAEKKSKGQHAIYRSAGMAAAGMGAAADRVSPPLPQVEAPAIAPAPDLAPLAHVAAPPTPPASPLPSQLPAKLSRTSALRAVVMGHTDAGKFGHHLDEIFLELAGVTLAAISDGNSEALAESQRRSGAGRGFVDFREMLHEIQPEIAVVAPRWTNQRYDMVKAALESGAHVYCERPIARSLKEADELVALAQEKNLKVGVAHQMRNDPHVKAFHRARPDLIGDLLEMHVYGKMDHRAGGEDLLVLGTHLFDLVGWFAGEPNFCTAQITRNGLPAIIDDAHESAVENLGPLLGDTIHAEFSMASGIYVRYVSDARLHETVGPWGIEFVGARGRARLFAEMPPTMSLLTESHPSSAECIERWSSWPKTDHPYHAPVAGLTGLAASNRHGVLDWLESIAENREPHASGLGALKSLEMIHGIWQAGLTMKRAYFPLVNRLHPLADQLT